MERFNKVSEAVDFVNIHNLDDFLIGLDEQNHILAKKKNWFNCSWLGRAIDNLAGNHFDKRSFSRLQIKLWH